MRRLLLSFVLALTFCSPVTVHVGVPHESAPDVAVPDPAYEKGDAVAGRRTFINSGCTDCHRVAEDAGLPPGEHAAAGPVLRDLGRYAPNQLAQRITSRNAGRGALVEKTTMPACAQHMTETQLVDVIAYLRGLPRG